ncbi:MAG: hypothetical protein AB1414_18570, partial [bacterium]
MEDYKAKIETLKKLIRYHDYKYYVEAQPEISDYNYDQLLKELIQLEMLHPECITQDSPTQRVNRQLMLTLDNTYSIDELKESNLSTDSTGMKKEKYLQIFNYLLEFSKLRCNPVRNIESSETQYPNIIWFADIPQNELFDCI